jgi:hypothetical protein
MLELTPDHDQRYPFTGHLDRMGMRELVRRGPSPHASADGGVAQLDPDAGGGAWSAACRAAQHAEQCADRKRGSDRERRVQLLPSRAVHSDLAALAQLPCRTRTAPSLRPSGSSPATRMTAMISSIRGGRPGG